MSRRRGTSVYIETDSETSTSGDAITGKVVIFRKKRLKKLACILLKLEGGAIVSIIDHFDETPITSIECCLNASLPLAGEVNSSSSASTPAVIIKPGRNEYKFTYNLPSSLPSTFHGKYGSISYSLRVLLLLRSKRIYASAKVPLVISGLRDLNSEAGARNSAHLQREAKIWSLAMCHHGKVKLHFSMPKQGYVPNEVLGFTALMSNFTFNYVKFTQISLIQVIFYIIEGRRKKTQTNILVEKRGPRIEPGRALTWRGDDPKCDLRVPNNALPTRASAQSTIQIHYQLQIKIKESSTKSNRETPVIEAFLPLTIGTVPLEDILVPIIRQRSPSPPPSPFEDFDFMDADDDDEDCTNDELTNDERSEASMGRSRASSSERIPPPYASFTKEYFI